MQQHARIYIHKADINSTMEQFVDTLFVINIKGPLKLIKIKNAIKLNLSSNRKWNLI